MKKVLAVLFAALLLGSCSLMPVEEQLPAAPMKKTADSIEYLLAATERKDLSLTKLVNCSYRSAGSETVVYQTGGETLAAVYVSLGEYVEKGQLLGELSMGTLDNDIQSAQLTLQQTALDISYLTDCYQLKTESLRLRIAEIQKQLELSDSEQPSGEETTQNVLDTKGLEVQLASLKSELQSLQKNYQSSLQQKKDAQYIAEKRLDELRQKKKSRQLYAGVSGNISYLTAAAEGDLVYEGGSFAVISNLDTSVFLVSGEDAAYFPVGERYSVSVKREIYEAISVSAASLGLAETEDTAFLQLTDPLAALEEGSNGQITIVKEYRENALAVPRKAIFYKDGETVVFCLDESGRKYLQPVTVGITTSGGDTEIISGLSEGQQVVVSQEE